MSAFNLNKHNFQEEVINSEKPVLVDFWASWCGPCRMVSPIVEQIAEEYPQYKIGKVNIDEEPELASQYGIMSIPTLLVVKNGEITNKSIGAKNKKQILEMFQN